MWNLRTWDVICPMSELYRVSLRYISDEFEKLWDSTQYIKVVLKFPCGIGKLPLQLRHLRITLFYAL